MEEPSAAPDPVDAGSPRPNPYTVEAATDPLPHYEQLRRCPVTTFLGGTHLVSRYEDVRAVLHAPDTFSSDATAIWIGQQRPMIPLQVDPPDHARYRRLLDPLLAPGAVEPLRADLQALLDGILDDLAGRDEVDFHREVSVPFAATAFLALLGLPTDEADDFVAWKDAIIRPGTTPRDVAAGRAVREEAAAALYDRFALEADERRRAPRADWLTSLVEAELDGRALTTEEVQDICFVLLLGGLDTVTAALDCAVVHLARHDDDRRRLVADPTLVPAAVEELLRHESPVMQVPRVVRAPVELAGHRFEPGDKVRVVLGAADTDERTFPDADRVVLDRSENRHLAFGAGPHRCLGMHLARLELRLGLATWHRRVPDYALADPDGLEVTPVIREIPRLPLRIGAVAPR